MNDLAVATITNSSNALSEHLRRGSAYLANATSAAEILEAKAAFGAAYDESRRVARLAEAKGAHDKVLADIHRAMAEALEGEASAKRLLADEYDAAQARGEIPKHGGKRGNQHTGGKFENAKVANISPSDIHEARIIRDAEEAEPGIVKRTIKAAVDAGEEPTRAKVRRAVVRTVRPEVSAPQPKRGKAAIAARVCDGLAALSGLPPPGEVVGYLRGTDAAVLVDERLPVAYRWLREFTDLWSEQGEDNAEAAQ